MGFKKSYRDLIVFSGRWGNHSNCGEMNMGASLNPKGVILTEGTGSGGWGRADARGAWRLWRGIHTCTIMWFGKTSAWIESLFWCFPTKYFIFSLRLLMLLSDSPLPPLALWVMQFIPQCLPVRHVIYQVRCWQEGGGDALIGNATLGGGLYSDRFDGGPRGQQPCRYGMARL